MRGWIGVDLDGTLAYYDEKVPHSSEMIGEPIFTMVQKIKDVLAQGYGVRIVTARVSTNSNSENIEQVRLVQDWLVNRCGLPRLDITCKKDYQMIELWDDRARRVKMNTGEFE